MMELAPSYRNSEEVPQLSQINCYIIRMNASGMHSLGNSYETISFDDGRRSNNASLHAREGGVQQMP